MTITEWLSSPSTSAAENNSLELRGEKVYKVAPDGWSRLKQAWLKCEDGFRGFEGDTMVAVVEVSMLIGLYIGGVRNYRQSLSHLQNLIKGARYISKWERLQRQNDFLITRFMYNGLKEGLRLSALVGTTSGTAFSLTAYFDDIHWWYVPISSAVGGAVGRFNFGPKGWLVGATIFSIFICPTVLPLYAYAQHFSNPPLSEWYKSQREKHYYKKLKEAMEITELVALSKEEGMSMRPFGELRKELAARKRALKEKEEEEELLSKVIAKLRSERTVEATDAKQNK